MGRAKVFSMKRLGIIQGMARKRENPRTTPLARVYRTQLVGVGRSSRLLSCCMWLQATGMWLLDITLKNARFNGSLPVTVLIILAGRMVQPRRTCRSFFVPE